MSEAQTHRLDPQRDFRQARLRALYDEEYVADYESRFLMAEWPKAGADFEASILRRLLIDNAHWLDVGCGTGYFLSLFADVARAGIDLSPAMVKRAREANPEALFIEEHDFLDDVPAWHGKWDVVSCIWQPYNYLQSIWEVEQLVENMARWTAPGGACFIPIVDLADIRHQDLPYEGSPGVWGGVIALTGVTWTWEDAQGNRRHEHLVAPQVEHFVRRLEPHFRAIEVLRYPPFRPGWVQRKAVVASLRRIPGDNRPAAVIRHPRAVPADTRPLDENRPPAPAAAGLSTAKLVRELLRRAMRVSTRLLRILVGR